MRMMLTKSGLQVFVNNNEWEFLDGQPDTFNRADLDDREKHIASQLYRRGVLIAKKINDEIVYKRNKINPL